MDSSGADRRSRGSDDYNNQVLVVAVTPEIYGGFPPLAKVNQIESHQVPFGNSVT
ncbi:hypothetical protein LYNGBM3L_67780 [Moorena producens 3L]|uniref:Uncharacterized protein n=1 Tax=Moorena producens 3L TaxID=489825 RepID=F4Y1C9_9CYAN|nr:hypothetical protein LYNGBM3L_67780 [Moorena producens 3L]